MSPFSKRQKKWIWAGGLFAVLFGLWMYIIWPKDYQPPVQGETFQIRRKRFKPRYTEIKK